MQGAVPCFRVSHCGRENIQQTPQESTECHWNNVDHFNKCAMKTKEEYYTCVYVLQNCKSSC